MSHPNNQTDSLASVTGPFFNSGTPQAFHSARELITGSKSFLPRRDSAIPKAKWMRPQSTSYFFALASRYILGNCFVTVSLTGRNQ